MTTATAKPPKQPPTTAELAEQIRRSTADRVNQCDALLRHLALTNQRPTPEDRLLFHSLGWPAHIVRHKIVATREILALQKQGGTAAERKAAQDKLTLAKQRMDTEGKAMQEQIAKLLRELRSALAGIEGEVRDAQAAVDAHESARQRLRARLPEHVRSSAEETFAEIRGRYSPRISELRAAINLALDAQRIEIGTLDGRTQATHVARCNGFNSFCEGEAYERTERDAEHRTPHSRREDYIDPAQWRADVQELLARVPKLEAELRELEAKREAELSAAESQLDYYLQ